MVAADKDIDVFFYGGVKEGSHRSVLLKGLQDRGINVTSEFYSVFEVALFLFIHTIYRSCTSTINWVDSRVDIYARIQQQVAVARSFVQLSFAIIEAGAKYLHDFIAECIMQGCV